MYRLIIILLAIISVSRGGEDYYKILGIKKDADQREIRRAFKKLAVTEHPDKKIDDPEAHEKFVRLTTVYEVLKDPELRKKYDLYGEEGLDQSNKRKTYHSWNYYHDNFGIYDDDPEIITLSIHEYFDNVANSEKMWLINFYSPMCSHCHHLAPIWRKVAKELEGVIRVGAVNCEDDWRLCQQVGVHSYPTLLHYPKNSQHGIRYNGDRTYEAIIKFVIDRLDYKIKEISSSLWNLLIEGKKDISKPLLIFTCGIQNNCFTDDDRRKVAAIFDKMIDVQTFYCKGNTCNHLISHNTNAVYLPMSNEVSWAPVILEDIEDVATLVQKILMQLPEPQELSLQEFEEIKTSSKKQNGWLICFYMGHVTELDLLLKKLPGIINTINIGKINCGKYIDLCSSLNVNRYPMWGVLKPSGAIELNHGKSTLNDIAKFAENSIKAVNVWALSAEKVISILKRANGNEVWFLDWYAPWCPPCMQFLPELRKASLEFDTSIIQFGTIDCTVHSSLCRQYNIASYPTAMLINGTNTHQFTLHKTASNVIQFINDIRNPSVIELTSTNFHQLSKKKSELLYVVDYYAPWCGPCQQLMPEWSSVAKTLQHLSFVKVAKVNCEQEKQLCRDQEIHSYPTIRLYPISSEGLNTVVLYRGSRDSMSILKWVAEFFPNRVHELNSNTFQAEVLNSQKVWIIDFYAPWCGYCIQLEPQFLIAAQLEDKIWFGKINCDRYGSLCIEAGIRAYPTLMIYDKNKRKVNDAVKIEGKTAESISKNLKSYLSNNKYDRDEL
ncbi:dnaJ homolog subfamily C member 10-like [Prorops nasuta]|uniref:dnaJ homolog subfamily C member 10-like n=1 Tax=Prorops nasuta TaxID=863751 RepID=UPI0034CEF675